MSARPFPLLLGLAVLGALGACSDGSDTSRTMTGSTAVTPAPVASADTVAPPAATAPVTTTPGTPIIEPGMTTPVLAVAPLRLNGNDIANTVSGNTVSGRTSDGKPYYMKFQRSGTVTFREGADFSANGGWRVLSDQLCTHFDNIANGVEHCYAIYRNGPNGDFVYERPDGHPIGNFTVSPGA